MKIAGVLRDKVFSPHSNDQRIMDSVAEKLREYGQDVTFYSEEDVLKNGLKEETIFSMARGKACLEKLQHYAAEGLVIVNPPEGVQGCERSVITRLMYDNGIAIPDSTILYIGEGLEIPEDIAFPCWLKRADVCAQEKNDVCYVEDRDTLLAWVEDFRQRGIPEAVISQHIEGDIIKFYGVDDLFFYWYYPTLGTIHSKFGLEEKNGPAQQYPFSLVKLRGDVQKVSKVAQVPVYGGDCIVDKNGKCWIIDFNDWPSFSPCIEDAATAIVKYILK